MIYLTELMNEDRRLFDFSLSSFFFCCLHLIFLRLYSLVRFLLPLLDIGLFAVHCYASVIFLLLCFFFFFICLPSHFLISSISFSSYFLSFFSFTFSSCLSSTSIYSYFLSSLLPLGTGSSSPS